MKGIAPRHLWIPLWLIVSLVAGCAMPIDPTFQGISRFQNSPNASGKDPGFAIGLDFYNPNPYKLSILAYDLAISLNNAQVGTAQHRGRQVMAAKAKSTISFFIRSDTQQLLNGVIGALGGLLGKKKAFTVGVQGELTARALGIRKRIQVEIERDYEL
jgi:LEA14-like dessication related protein